MAAPRDGRIVNQGGGERILRAFTGFWESRPACPARLVTHCCRQSGILEVDTGHALTDTAASTVSLGREIGRELRWFLWQAGQVRAPLGGDVSLKTILGWLAVAFIVWWVIEQPDGAAHIVHNIGTFLTTVASGLSHFFAAV
jgi:hypothetical protein